MIPGMTTTISTTAPSCPRCGYEQSGVVAAWTDRCPLGGVCSECGCTFSWSRVYTTARHPWLFEYHWRSRPLHRLTQTIWNALRPNRFWRDVTIDDPIHLWPVAIAALLVYVGVGIACFLWATVSYFSELSTMQLAPAPWWSPEWSLLVPALEEAVTDVPPALLLALTAPTVMVVAMPVFFVIYPWLRRMSKVRIAHLARIAIYSAIAPCVGATIWLITQILLPLFGYSSIADATNPWTVTEAHLNRTDNTAFGFFTLASFFPVMFITLWLTIWWTIASRIYLGFIGGRLLILLLAIASGLAGLLAITLFETWWRYG